MGEIAKFVECLANVDGGCVDEGDEFGVAPDSAAALARSRS